jgi:hypothetical protein
MLDYCNDMFGPSIECSALLIGPIMTLISPTIPAKPTGSLWTTNN